MGEKGQGLYILIITGLSGAGKTQVINCLEDIGYYCVDNLPPTLISKFVELSIHSEGKIKKIALVIDVRGGEFFDDLSEALGDLKEEGIRHEIIFLEASDEVLVRRYKESRRRHPLAVSGSSLIEALKAEREMLAEFRGKANLVINTSTLTPRELKEKLTSRFSESESEVFSINILSFGYKMGMPLDADIVMDVRFLPNPFYDPIMQKMTGKDQEVINFVLDSPVTKSFNRRFINLLKYLIPYYIEEGKTNLTVAIGCTGGQHRSVVLAKYTGRQLKKMGYNVIIRHRDVAKYKVEE